MLRITAGEWKGRSFIAPSNENTRPTQAKLRQALFNSIQTHVPEARVLDLFAGSGALGFEALSRGAQFVTFVESSRLVIPILRKNVENFKAQDRVHLLQGAVEESFPQILRSGPYDLVLADPPYAAGWELRLLTDLSWESLLIPGGLLCLEWSPAQARQKELPAEIACLVKTREKHYGDSMLTTYLRKEL